MEEQEVPNLEELHEAFKGVFAKEQLLEVEYACEKDRTILAFTSLLENGERQIRRYAHTPGVSYHHLLVNTPHLDDPKS